MNLPRPIRKLIESFERLPGIGPKTAARLAFYLLHVPQELLEEFAESLVNLKKNTVLCSICFNVSEKDPCPICSDQNRDKSIICVVEQPLDVLALEKTGNFQGVYHVLHGAISPLDNIGPDEIKIAELIDRLKESFDFVYAEENRSAQDKQESGKVEEIILATNPNMEGEATAMYIANEVRKLKTKNPALPAGRQKLKTIHLTRLGQGLPTGADMEYADEVTLSRALEGRREYK